MSAANPFSTPPRIFTLTTSNNAAFRLNPDNSAAVRMMTIQWISGTVTIRGNASTINLSNSAGTSVVTLSDGVITLSSSLSTLTLVGNGNDALDITIDSSAGSAALILYV